MNIRDAEKLLNNLLHEDRLAFYKITSNVYYSETGKEYSLFGILNLMFGNDSEQLGFYYDKKTDSPMKVAVVTKQEYLKMIDRN